MDNQERKTNRNVLMLVLSVVLTVALISGSTFAYWEWWSNESEQTAVTFTATEDFSCSADGGGNITSSDVVLIPSSCTDSEHVIKRKVTVMPSLYKDDLNISLDLWMNIKSIGNGLSNSENFKYALTTDDTSCESGVVSEGTFKGKTSGDTITMLDKEFNNTTTETYYLWIWLDEAETDISTTNQSFELSLDGECSNFIDLSNEEILEYLQNKHDFEYYSTLNLAVTDVNNGTIGENADSNKEDAVAGIYTDDGETYVVLLKDTIEATRIKPSVDMTINLGGNMLSSNEGIAIQPMSGNVHIDGTIDGSTVSVASDYMPRAMQVLGTSNVTVTGGLFVSEISKSSSSNSVTILVAQDARLTITNAIISSKNLYASSNTTAAAGIQVSSGGTASAVISDCVVDVESVNGRIYGINNFATMTVSNSEIMTYSNHRYIDNTYYASSNGVYNSGTITLNNCYVSGTYTGVNNLGTLYINGGIYEGYEYGGLNFYASETTSYIRNATIRQCSLADGYTQNLDSKNVGFRVAAFSNILIYMDNCDIYGSQLVGTITGSYNSLYISNSRINEDAIFNLSSSTHKIYIGRGNNFTADDINRPTSGIETDEVYIFE